MDWEPYGNIDGRRITPRWHSPGEQKMTETTVGSIEFFITFVKSGTNGGDSHILQLFSLLHLLLTEFYDSR